MNSKRGDGYVFRRGSVWWIKYYRNGIAFRESSGSVKAAKARELLRKRLGEISLGRFIGPHADKIRIAELSIDFENDYKVNGKKSLDKARQTLNHVLAFFGDYRAHRVGTDLVRKYIALRQEEKAANATINRELSTLKRMFNLGMQAEKIYRKPYIPMLQENNVRTGFLEYGEFIALREAAPEYFKPVLSFAFFTGWRKQEILSLKWNQVDLTARTIRLDPGTTKSGEGRVIVLDGELLDVITKQWEERKVAEIPGQSPALLSPYVFHHRNGRRLGDIRDVWAAVCKTAELNGKLFHDFRARQLGI